MHQQRQNLQLAASGAPAGGVPAGFFECLTPPPYGCRQARYVQVALAVVAMISGDQPRHGTAGPQCQRLNETAERRAPVRVLPEEGQNGGWGSRRCRS